MEKPPRPPEVGEVVEVEVPSWLLGRVIDVYPAHPDWWAWILAAATLTAVLRWLLGGGGGRQGKGR